MGGASGIWRRREVWRIVGPILAVAVTATGAQAQCQYDVTIIQAPVCPAPLEEPPVTIAIGLNELGQVVGYHRQCDELTFDEAFVWTPETGLLTLDRPTGFDGARANDINDSGDIVGSLRMNNRFHGALWQGGQVIELGTMPGGNFSVASALNATTQVVGWWGNSITGDPALSAFVWESGRMVDLQLRNGTNSIAPDVNDGGQIVGWMGCAPFIDAHAYLWDNGLVMDLDVIPDGFTGEGKAINSLSEVVVSGLLDQGGQNVTRSFLWANEQFTDLGTLPGFDRCFASDVNDASQVIGICDQSSNPNNDVPFVWQGGIMSELSMLIADDGGLQLLRNVNSINNAGQIAGRGIGPDGHVVAVLLTPVNSSPGDVNGDCVVNVLDLIDLLLCFGQSAQPPCNLSDVDGSGVVNVLDLIILLLNFGS